MNQLGNDQEPSCSSAEPEVLPGYKTFQDFTKESFKMLGEAIRNSNALPLGRDWDFYKTSDTFRLSMNNESTSILRTMNQVMHSYDMDANIRTRVLDDRNEMVIEVNDVILDRAAINLDELKGIRKNIPQPELQTVSAHLPVNGSWNRIENVTVTINDQPTSSQSSSMHSIKLVTAKNIIRPQSFFKTPVDNRNNPWEPRIKYKPNSLKPLAIFLEECDGKQEYSHPYEFELDRYEPSAAQLEEVELDLPKPITLTPLIEITEPEQLQELVETLRDCTEFGVDLEHHSYRTFMGITCLMQISTVDKDYLIDTLKLRDNLHVLNEVFTKNDIVKIFHGADSDMEWLQRDLSLYVVNMFDTHQAAKLLEYSGLSLAYLMKRFCDVVPDKQFQLADWRIRPLPDSFKHYAREDTHYLIYIYKCLRNELLKKGNGSDRLLKAVIERSTQICRKRYFKPILTDDSHMDIYRRFKKMFDNRQMYALKEMYAWRDAKAREEDESLAYVLPNHMLLHIAETLPREMQGILACCSPIPPLVRSHLLELHQIVLKAREQPLEKPIFKDQTTGRGVIKSMVKVNVDSPLHCPHDLSKTSEFRDDLPTILTQNNALSKIVEAHVTVEKQRSQYSVFNDKKRARTLKKQSLNYLSPYKRYQLVQPFVREEEDRLAKENEDSKVKDQEKTGDNEREQAVTGDGDKRSDEDRIASIREHYLKMSKKFSEELEEKTQKHEEEDRKDREKTLLQMGGSRKRKRDESEVIFEGPATDTSLETPVPFQRQPFRGNRNKGKNRGKKRKFQEMNAESEPPQSVQNPASNQQWTKPQPPQQQGKKNRNNFQNRNQGNSMKRRRNPQSPHQQQQSLNQSQNQSLNQQGPSKQQQNHHQFQQNNQFDNNVPNPARNQQRNRAKNRRQNQQQTQFVPYDYTSVDFRQFQGGAGSANLGVQVKPKFKPKGNNNRNNMRRGGEKSAVFPNTNNRGRGNRK